MKAPPTILAAVSNGLENWRHVRPPQTGINRHSSYTVYFSELEGWRHVRPAGTT